MKEAILATDIMSYIPHRPPMVWIDEVTDYSASGGECLVRVKQNALYMGPQGLRASSCLELMAQAYAFLLGLSSRP
ncbi:MAG: hypothetical protein HC902_10395 [Calothrix sp. SM1_5_4]|nr:hypothetical protein [Calothrix sp. SM1_5_4]